jgi:hypothetical protein
MLLRKPMVYIAALLLLVSASRAQDSPDQKQQPVFRTQANVVLVPTLVKDKNGGIIYGDARGKLQQKGNAVDVGELATKLAIMSVQALRENTSKTIAAMTGGEYELFKSHAGFESRMMEFANHLHSRYLLSFEPKDPHSGLHKVRVRLRRSENATVVARDRYWAGEF